MKPITEETISEFAEYLQERIDNDEVRSDVGFGSGGLACVMGYAGCFFLERPSTEANDAGYEFATELCATAKRRTSPIGEGLLNIYDANDRGDYETAKDLLLERLSKHI